MLCLREYQKVLINHLLNAFLGFRRVLLTIPTGSGKTVVASEIIRHANSNSKKVLFICHRRELLFQTIDKLRLNGVEASTMLSGEAYDSTKNIVVATVQTMHSWVVRRKKEIRPEVDLVIIDECAHLPGSRTWQDIASLYPKSFILGLTATPISKSGKGLGDHFDHLVNGPSVKELVKGGWLVGARYFVPSVPDLMKVEVSNGDYVEKQLEGVMDQPKLVGDICENWSRICPDRKTIVFASGVKHSIHISEEFNRIGVKADHIDGMTDKKRRREILDSFINGDVKVLSNCAVLTEGWDGPPVSCLILARPTKSLMLYLQTAGRVLRPFPGKKDTIIICHSGAVYEHGPVDQEFDWKLSYLSGDVERRAKLKKESASRTITCGNCKFLYSGKLDCPLCGFRPKINGKIVETYEAYLSELSDLQLMEELPKFTTRDRRIWYAAFRYYAREHGYKPGWAYHKYREKFQRNPANIWRGDEPIPPPKDVLSYISYLRIKWIKSQEKRNGLGTIRENTRSHKGQDRADKLDQEELWPDSGAGSTPGVLGGSVCTNGSKSGRLQEVA